MIAFDEARNIIRAWEREPGCEAQEAALAERYPFLSMGPGHGTDEADIAAMSSMPCGWRRAFGAEMFEDLRTALLAAGGEHALLSYRVDQVKEKFGEMRWYASFSGCKSPARFDFIGTGISAKLDLAGAGSPAVESAGDDALRWVERISELYCSIAGRVCVRCGTMEGVGVTGPWIMPVCPDEGYPIVEELPPVTPDAEFCVWKSLDGGEEVRESYKDLCAGADAPAVAALGLRAPLLVTEVWERLCEAQGSASRDAEEGM